METPPESRPDALGVHGGAHAEQYRPDLRHKAAAGRKEPELQAQDPESGPDTGHRERAERTDTGDRPEARRDRKKARTQALPTRDRRAAPEPDPGGRSQKSGGRAISIHTPTQGVTPKNNIF